MDTYELVLLVLQGLDGHLHLILTLGTRRGQPCTLLLHLQSTSAMSAPNHSCSAVTIHTILTRYAGTTDLIRCLDCSSIALTLMRRDSRE